MLLKGLLESQSKSSVFWRASQVSHLLLRSISSWLVLLCTTSCVIAIYVMRSLMPVMLTCRWRLLTTKWHLTRWESRFGEGKFGSVPLKDHKFRYIPSLSHWHVEFTWVNDMWVRWYISNFEIFKWYRSNFIFGEWWHHKYHSYYDNWFQEEDSYVERWHYCMNHLCFCLCMCGPYHFDGNKLILFSFQISHLNKT